ncbi:hypothetical protein ACX80S_04285 [Arthrobacter sp. RHLT1-20]
MNRLRGFPDQVDTVFVELSYIPEEEDRPETVLRFPDISKVADSATLSTTIAGLKEPHSNLGGIIRGLEQA